MEIIKNKNSRFYKITNNNNNNNNNKNDDDDDNDDYSLFFVLERERKAMHNGSWFLK